MTNFVEAAKVLEELMLILRNEEISIPVHVTDDLKSGRSLAHMGMRSNDDEQIEAKATACFQNVEMNLLSLTEIKFGREAADEWQRRLNEAYKLSQTDCSPAAPAQKKFIPGIPKGSYWVRVMEKFLNEAENPQQLLENYKLEAKPQDDDFVLIYGVKENVIEFLEELGNITKEALKDAHEEALERSEAQV